MAEKRTFSKEIIELPWFYKMSSGAQALYFHICMNADDEGFCADVDTCIMKSHASQDDYKVLVAKRFVLERQEGVIVVKHWWVNNSKHGWKPKDTIFIESKEGLFIKGDGSYTLDPDKGHPVTNPSPSSPIGAKENGREVKGSKENLKEENLKEKNITPAPERGWNGHSLEKTAEIAKTPWVGEDDELF